jgi:acyl-CoA synthetase (AMP-forming)/AMP-acid ligase II
MHLTQGLHRARQIAGSRTAVIDPEGLWTWNAFTERIARLAGALRQLGIEDGGRVAILAHSSHRYLEYYYATLWAGGIIVPLSTRLPAAALAELVDDAGARILLADDALAETALALQRQAGVLRHVLHAVPGTAPAGMLPYEEVLAHGPPIADAMRGGEEVAGIFYTGGTTGRPKGVMLTHANLFANAMNGIAYLPYDDRTVHLHCGPLYHVAAGSRVFTTTIAGGTHVVIPRFAPRAVLEAIERHRVTTFSMVPTMMTMLLEDPEFERFDLSSLELLSYGAAPMPETLIRAWIERLPQVRFAQAYGMTELSPACTYLEPRFHTLSPENARRLRSAGRAAYGVDVRVVDGEDREVPPGELGEIVVRGPIVMKGYWNDPDLTREALRGGFMHTGDIGSMDADGFLTVADRLKDMIVTGGENVYSVEVENAVLKHPDVRQCAVIGVPHPLWGESVHAVVALKPGRTADAAAIVAHARGLLAAFACPRSVEFIDEMPLSSANKILKTELRRPHWAGRDRNVS